jgi:hypothetical protein
MGRIMMEKGFASLRLLVAAALLCVSPPCDAAQSKGGAPARRETRKAHDVVAVGVPFTLDSQRILLEVALETLDGGARNALVWFNMGMAAPVLSKDLYRKLAIDRRRTLRIAIGDRTIEADSSEIVDGDGGLGVPDFPHLFAPRPVEAMLPASLLQHFVVTLDYGRRTFALAEPDAQKPDGVAVPCLINPKTGVVALEAEIGGASYPLAIDAGSGYSWMRGDVARRWLSERPDWRRAEGAFGQANANMVDYAFEKDGVVLRIPQVTIGALSLDNVGALGTAPLLGGFGEGLFGDLFWDNWRKAAPAPVIGWLGGNVLKDYKLTIDYPNRMTYWRKQRAADPHELDQVGLTLVRRDDQYFIGGVVRKLDASGAEAPMVEGVRIGDELVAVDGASVRGAGKDTVLSALQGKPGERRRLLLERGAARIEADVAVTRFE